jgi:hypothetical protein
LQEPVHAL